MNNLDKLRELSTKLIAMQDSLSAFFHFCPDMLCMADKTGHFIQLNPAWETALGFTLTELMSVPYATFIHPDDLKITAEAEKQLNKKEGVFNFINRYRHKNGTYRWLSWTCTAYMADNICYAVARDITKERETEAKLKETQEELQDFFENAPIALHWADEQGKIIWANKMELSLLGYSIEDYVGKNVCDFYKDQTLCQKIFSKLLNDEPINNLRTQLIKHDGSELNVLISANLLKRDGMFIHTRNFTRDITEGI